MRTRACVPQPMATWRHAAWRAARCMRPLATTAKVPAAPHCVCPRVACASSAASSDGTGSGSGEHVVVTQLRSSLAEHHLVGNGACVVTCCSGGVDSVALLLALHSLAPELALSLHVLHFNHGLRAESPGEAELVQRLAERLQLPFHVRTAPPGSWPPSGVSDAARAWRRKEAVALAESLGSTGNTVSHPRAVVALAHHADDQRETVLLKLLRGCHVSRISGMAPRQGPFIRPLLACTKAQLVDFARCQRAAWAEDASNADASYSRRNAVRHRLVPLLQELTGGGLDARLHDAQHQSRVLRAWLDGVPPTWAPPRGGGVYAHVTLPSDDDDDDSEAWVEGDESGDDAHDAVAATHLAPGELDLPRWRALTALTRLDQLHAFVEAHTRCSVAYATLRELAARAESPEGRPRWSAHIHATWRLVRSGDRLRVQQWSHGGASVSDADEEVATTTTLGGLRVHHPASWRVTLRVMDGETASTTMEGGSAGREAPDQWWSPAFRQAGMTLHSLPADAELTLRTRRDGDRFTPYWRAGGAGGGAAGQGGKAWKLKDLLRETGMPIHVRDTLPLVCLGQHLVAVYPAWVDAAVRGPTAAEHGRVSVHITVADA